MKTKNIKQPVIAVARISHYADGKEFEMTLDGDAPENQPLKMVKRDGYDGKWKHNGPTVKSTQTRRFKWVTVGCCYNLDEVRGRLKIHGKIPEGQWREAVKKGFEPDGQHPRGIADPSWKSPRGLVSFPYVSKRGFPSFYWADYVLNVRWRWLVEVESKKREFGT